jgi:sigma-E factor negative regulatory protein RseC
MNELRQDAYMSDGTGMLEETARVVDVKEGLLIAETISRSSCKSCKSDSCTTSVIAGLFNLKPNRLVMRNSIGAKPGDQVVIGIPDDLLARASVMAYLLPLVSMLLLTAIGDQMYFSPLATVMMAASGLVIGFFIVRRATRGWSSQRYQPQLLRVVSSGYQQVELPAFTRS